VLLQARTSWRTVVVVVVVVTVVVAVTAAASVEAAAFAAVLTVAGFAVALTAVAFAAVAFAAAGSTIATSTIDSSSLAILGTRSFTIPIHIMGTIPTAIILMVTDTVAFAVVAFAVVAFAVVAFVEVAFVEVAFVAVGDPYNQPVYQGSGGYTDSLIVRVQLRLARAGYERAHGLPEDGKIGQQLLLTVGLG
jgi:hypothetical protein